MAKLSFTHWITEKRDFGKKTVNQRMDILVDYDPQTEDVEVDAVYIFEGSIKLAEISKLLDKAEGDPLYAMVNAIDWKQMYYEHKQEMLVLKSEDEKQEAA